MAEAPRYLTPGEINYILEGIPNNQVRMHRENLQNIIIVPSGISELKRAIQVSVNDVINAQIEQNPWPASLMSSVEQLRLNSYNFRR